MQVNLWGYDVNTFRSGYLLESEAFTQPLNGGGGGGDGCYRLPLVQEHFAVYWALQRGVIDDVQKLKTHHQHHHKFKRKLNKVK